MVNLVRNVPRLPAVLAATVLWTSLAWGLPAEPPAAEGEAETSAPAEAEP